MPPSRALKTNSPVIAAAFLAAERQMETWPPGLGRDLLHWYLENRRDLPWRRLWQQHRDPYHVWLSEIMLQQTTIPVVMGRYASFLQAFPTIASLAAADEESVRLATRGLGYYRRFSLMHRAAQTLQEAGGAYPTHHDQWRNLPGIGDYTAAAIASITLNAPVAVVDGNVERVLCRLFDWRMPPNQPALKPMYRQAAARLLTPDAPGDFNQALMELGQRLCTKSSQPLCAVCPLASGCLARLRGSQALAPAAKPQAAKKDVPLLMHVVRRRDGKVALVQRDLSARFLKGTWGFPYEPLPAPMPSGLTGPVKHSITQHDITLWIRCDAALLPPAWEGREVRWLDAAAVDAQLLANFDRKVWTQARKVWGQTQKPRHPRSLFADEEGQSTP